MFIDVWPISLRVAAATCFEIESVLSLEEKARAARFRFPEHAFRFRICHAAVRNILASYLAMPAERIEMATTPRGKPYLAGASQPSFNLSHSGDMALLAVSEGSDLGVDLEAIRSDLSIDRLAGFFTAAEREHLRAAGAAEKERTFFRWWTRKEAILKAEGSGISGGLDQLDISGSPPDLVPFPADGGRLWRVEDLDVGPDYAGAVAAPPGEWRIRWRQFE